MTDLLDSMELALADLMQSGFATGGPAAAGRLGELALACESSGLHTGGALLSEIQRALTARSHTEEKNDLPLAAAVCRAARYIQLCRERLEEEQILERWQSIRSRRDRDEHDA